MTNNASKNRPFPARQNWIGNSLEVVVVIQLVSSESHPGLMSQESSDSLLASPASNAPPQLVHYVSGDISPVIVIVLGQ